MNFLSTMLSGREAIRGGANSSGSDVRDDGLVAYGFSALQGKRHNMEDYTQVRRPAVVHSSRRAPFRAIL